MRSLIWLRRGIAVAGATGLALTVNVLAQDGRHGRKYKAPPVTSHLEVLVLRDTNGKVVENAGVVFHPSKDGVDEGNLEVKSGTDGKAFIDIIPTGSQVQIQVISSGFTTYSGDFTLDGPSKQVTVRLKRPERQVSSYGENVGVTTVGVQESTHRVITAPVAPKPIGATDPVIKLPGMPASPKQGGDATVPKDHNVKLPVDPTPPKQPNKTSSPTGPTVDGTAAGSPPTS